MAIRSAESLPQSLSTSFPIKRTYAIINVYNYYYYIVLVFYQYYSNNICSMHKVLYVRRSSHYIDIFLV